MNVEERLEVRLREELAQLARVPVPGLSERVLARLPERRAHGRRAQPVFAAAAAALLLGLAAAIWMDAGGIAVTPERATVQAPSATPVRAWVALGAPLEPEAALRDEGRRLVSDTRRAAVSLWDRLPLTSLFARETR